MRKILFQWSTCRSILDTISKFKFSTWSKLFFRMIFIQQMWLCLGSENILCTTYSWVSTKNRKIFSKKKMKRKIPKTLIFISLFTSIQKVWPGVESFSSWIMKKTTSKWITIVLKRHFLQQKKRTFPPDKISFYFTGG